MRVFAVLMFSLFAATPSSAPSPASRPASSPARIRYVLEQPASSLDESAYERDLARRADQFASASRPSSEQADARAAAFLLDRCTEPCLSRLLLEIPQPADASTLARYSAQAMTFLGAASSAPAQSQPANSPDSSPDRRRLEALARAFTAIARCAQGQTASGSQDDLLNAARGLAGFLDDPRSEVADLARLLQGACYRRAGRAERAVQVLGALTQNQALPPASAIFARLEYCRALGDQGYYVAAIALALRLEVACSKWVPVAHRTAAEHTFRALRIRMMDAWAAHQEKSAGSKADAIMTREAAEKLRRSFGASDSIALYRLGHVLPDEAP